LSMYYHFAFRFCNARKGNEKGYDKYIVM